MRDLGVPRTAVWAKITWGDPASRRTFLVRSLQGNPLKEFEAESEAYAFARGEDDRTAYDGLIQIEAEPAPGEPEGEETIVMEAVLQDGSGIFFGIDGSGAKITASDQDRAVILAQIRTSPLILR